MLTYEYEGCTFNVGESGDPIGEGRNGTWCWTVTLQGTERTTGLSMKCTRSGTVTPGGDIKDRFDLQRVVHAFVLGGLTHLQSDAVVIFWGLDYNEAIEH